MVIRKRIKTKWKVPSKSNKHKFKSKNTIFIGLIQRFENNKYYLNHYSLKSYLILL